MTSIYRARRTPSISESRGFFSQLPKRKDAPVTTGLRGEFLNLWRWKHGSWRMCKKKHVHSINCLNNFIESFKKNRLTRASFKSSGGEITVFEDIMDYIFFDKIENFVNPTALFRMVKNSLYQQVPNPFRYERYFEADIMEWIPRLRAKVILLRLCKKSWTKQIMLKLSASKKMNIEEFLEYFEELTPISKLEKNLRVGCANLEYFMNSLRIYQFYETYVGEMAEDIVQERVRKALANLSNKFFPLEKINGFIVENFKL